MISTCAASTGSSSAMALPSAGASTAFLLRRNGLWSTRHIGIRPGGATPTRAIGPCRGHDQVVDVVAAIYYRLLGTPRCLSSCSIGAIQEDANEEACPRSRGCRLLGRS